MTEKTTFIHKILVGDNEKILSKLYTVRSLSNFSMFIAPCLISVLALIASFLGYILEP